MTDGENQTGATVTTIGTISIEKLSEMAREAANLEPEELRALPIVTRVELGPGNSWVPGQSVPKRADLYVFALFDGPDAHDVTAYVLPRDPKPVEEPHWIRYRMNRLVPTMMVEQMIRSTFIDQVGESLYALAIDSGIVEEDDDDTDEPEE